MSVTCFFCQNLLSDYAEKCITTARFEQVQIHLKNCDPCQKLHKDLASTQRLTQTLSGEQLSHEMMLRIMEASQGRKRSVFANPKVRTAVVGLVLPLVILAILVTAFPSHFSWAWPWRQPTIKTQFVRYYPLFQGAAAVLDDQTSLLLSADSFVGSLWEEGGLSPEDFEKAFRKKLVKE